MKPKANHESMPCEVLLRYHYSSGVQANRGGNLKKNDNLACSTSMNRRKLKSPFDLSPGSEEFYSDHLLPWSPCGSPTLTTATLVCYDHEI